MDVSIGARIKAARTAAGMTQMDVARRTDLSLQAVGDIERGIVRDPHISSLRQIARALGIPVTQMLEDSFRDPVTLAEAPPEQAGPNALTAKIVEVQEAYQSRLLGLKLLTERWETRLRVFGDEISKETLENMSIEGTYMTDFFIEAALEEMAKIALVVGHTRPEDLANGAAFEFAAQVSIMRPAYERWRALGDEIQRIGVELFGEEKARMSLENFEPGWAAQTGLNEIAKRRAEKIQVA